MTALQSITTPMTSELRSVYGLNGTRRVPARTGAADKGNANQPAVQERSALPETNDRREGKAPESKLDTLNRVVEDTNDSMAQNSRSLRFRVNQELDIIQVQVVDSSRDKVIRSIPSDEMLMLSVRMRELAGVGSMVDTSR